MIPREHFIGTVFEKKYLLTEVLGEGATSVTYAAIDLEQKNAPKLALKFLKILPFFDMSVLSYQFEIHEDWPAHPLRMSPEERTRRLVEEMIGRIKARGLPARIMTLQQIYAGTVRNLLKRVLFMIEDVVMVGTEYYPRMNLSEPRLSQTISDRLDKDPGVRSMLDEHLIADIEDLIETEELSADEHRVLDRMFALISERVAAKPSSLASNPLVGLAGLISDRFISMDESADVVGTWDFIALFRPIHIQELIDVLQVVLFCGKDIVLIKKFSHAEEHELIQQLNESKDVIEELKHMLIEHQGLFMQAGIRLLFHHARALKDEVPALYRFVSNWKGFEQIEVTAHADPEFQVWDPKPMSATVVVEPASSLSPVHPQIESVTGRPRVAPVTRSESPSHPLLVASRELSLSELDVHPEAHHYFRVGADLVTLHRLGAIHGDLHPANILFNPVRGATKFIDFGKSRKVNPPRPDKMILDFELPLDRLSWPEFRALAAGYLRAAHVDIEPDHPGYVDGWIKALGGSLSHCPVVKSPRVDLARALEAMGCELATVPGGLALVPITRSQHRLGDPLVHLALLIGNVDLSVDTPALAAPAAIETVAQALAAESLAAIRPARGDRADNKHAFQATVKALKTATARNRAEFSDALAELLIAIAVRQIANHRTAALSTAQYTLVLFQLSFQDPRVDEGRYIKLLQRLSNLKLWKASSGLAELWSQIACIDSLNKTAIDMFRASVGLDTLPLWSVGWDGMTWSFFTIERFLRSFVGLRPRDEELTVARGLFSAVLKRYFHAAQTLTRSALTETANRRSIWCAQGLLFGDSSRDSMHEKLVWIDDVIAACERAASFADFERWFAESQRLLNDRD